MSGFIGFVVAGGIAGAVNVGSRLMLNRVFSYEFSVLGAFLVALTVGYILNRTYVFKSHTAATSSQYLRFGLVNVAALAQVWLFSVGLARLVFPAVGFQWHPETIAHVIGVASPVMTSYMFYKFWVFHAAGADRG